MTFEQWSESIEQVVWRQKRTEVIRNGRWKGLRQNHAWHTQGTPMGPPWLKKRRWQSGGWDPQGETQELEHRSWCGEHPKCTWKPSKGFEGRVTRSDMYTNYHNARQDVMYWEEIPDIQEVRGEGQLQTQESKKTLRSWVDGQWEEANITKDGKSASMMLMESIGWFVHSFTYHCPLFVPCPVLGAKDTVVTKIQSTACLQWVHSAGWVEGQDQTGVNSC